MTGGNGSARSFGFHCVTPLGRSKFIIRRGHWPWRRGLGFFLLLWSVGVVRVRIHRRCFRRAVIYNVANIQTSGVGPARRDVCAAASIGTA